MCVYVGEGNLSYDPIHIIVTCHVCMCVYVCVCVCFCRCVQFVLCQSMRVCVCVGEGNVCGSGKCVCVCA